ncbi:MAG: F0F1 ATP synthase subunit delta, partial [bacterium]
MRERSLAKRYARGIVEAALSGEGDLDEIVRQMQALDVACREAKGFVKGLSDDRIKVAKRLEAVKSIAKTMGLGPFVTGLLLLLVKNRRARIIPMVASEAVDIISLREGKATAELSVAEDGIAAEVKARTEEILSHATNRKVTCDVRIDPGIIGGFRLKLDDFIYDAS